MSQSIYSESTSRYFESNRANVEEPIDKSLNCWKFCYDKDANTYCGRSCADWLKFTTFSILYIIFLLTFMMVLLYISLQVLKNAGGPAISKDTLRTYNERGGIGISIVPMVNLEFPVIWYYLNKRNYETYIGALTTFLDEPTTRMLKHKKVLIIIFEKIFTSFTNISEFKNKTMASTTCEKISRCKMDETIFGECSSGSFGYVENRPCFFIKINKEIGWSPRTKISHRKYSPLHGSQLNNETSKEIRLHCDGFYPWDKQHIGQIKYYPDPPVFDTSGFPYRYFDSHFTSPTVAVQISGFQYDVTITIKCIIEHSEHAYSSVELLLYVGSHS